MGKEEGGVLRQSLSLSQGNQNSTKLNASMPDVSIQCSSERNKSQEA